MKFCGECGTRLAFADLKGTMELLAARDPDDARKLLDCELKTGEPSMTCEGCGFLCPTNFAFCPKCGSSLKAARRSGHSPAGLASHPADADRRTVTALFADVSGFTALSERLDPEDVRAFQNDLFGSIADVVQQFGGFVEKFIGDAIFAIFGAPVAHEDDPERALRAALSMLTRMETLSSRWEPRFGGRVTLHVGITTGPVVAGSLGASGGGAYAVTGDTVNTAARLLSAAAPGVILASEATYLLTQHRFAFQSLGEVTLRGKAEPVRIYRVLSVLDGQRSARGLEALGLSAPLIGRSDELDRLLAAFGRMRAGRAQVVSIIGEAGTGKSRLISELLDRLEAEGRLMTTTVHRIACSSLGEPTYGVVGALLREAYQVMAQDSVEVAQQKLLAGLAALGTSHDEAITIAPVLGCVLGIDVSQLVQHVEPEQLQRQIMMAVRMSAERRLGQGPLLIVVEDVQWVDSASMELLRYVIGSLDDRPVLLLVSHRPTFDTRALATDRTAHTIISLTPISDAQTKVLLGAFFGPSVSTLPERLLTLIVTRAGGNPFYVEEVVRSLVTHGGLVRDGDGWRCTTDVSALNVPATIQGLLLSRLDQLAPDSRRLFQEASVFGVTFDEMPLRLMASDPSTLDVELDGLQQAELIREVGRVAEGRRFRFSYSMLQEVLYQNLLVSRRVELHARAGRALERLHGVKPERLEDLEALGHHFALSGDKRRGAKYLIAAGDWARSLYANDDAIRHYERTLVALAECGDCQHEQLTARECLGDLYALTGQRDPALVHYEAVREAHATARDQRAEARLRRKIGQVYWNAGDRDRARASCQLGLALLREHDEHIELAHLYQEMGRMAFRVGDNTGAIEWAERAHAHAEKLAAAQCQGGDEREIVAALAQADNTLGVALARMERSEEAIGHIERSAAIATAHGLLQAACRSYANLGILYSTIDPSRAIETCQRGLEIAKKIGDLAFQSRLYSNLALAYCVVTNRCDEQGIEAAETAIELDRRLGQLDHLAVPLIVLGQIYQCHGAPQQALVKYQEALAVAEKVGEPQLLFPCYDGLAGLYLEMGDDAQAERHMIKAQQVCARAEVDPDSLVVLPFLD
jgi:adenylate cyclase